MTFYRTYQAGFQPKPVEYADGVEYAACNCGRFAWIDTAELPLRDDWHRFDGPKGIRYYCAGCYENHPMHRRSASEMKDPRAPWNQF